MIIKKLCLLGIGLIGGSWALALRQAKACQHIVAWSRTQKTLEQALALNVIDSYTETAIDAVKDADVVVLATPLGAMLPILTTIQAHLSPHTILTDVGSAKLPVIDAVKTAFGEIPDNFVPAHPIAGSEKSGITAAFPELYQNRRIILTPLAHTKTDAIKIIEQLWQVVGAKLVSMTAEHHDQVLAATSHLPHVLAYGLVDLLAKMNDNQEIFKFSAGGFRDFTRIASSDPTMWHDICLANDQAILTLIDNYQTELSQIKQIIQAKDSSALLDLFQRAKTARDKFSEDFK